MTTQQAAALLKVDRSRVLYLIRVGRLKATRTGWSWSLDKMDVIEFRRTRRGPGRPPAAIT